MGAWLGTPGPWGTGLLGSLDPVSSEMLVHGSGSSGFPQMLIHGDASTRVRRPPVVDRGLVSRAIARLILAPMELLVLVSLIMP